MSPQSISISIRDPFARTLMESLDEEEEGQIDYDKFRSIFS